MLIKKAHLLAIMSILLSCLVGISLAADTTNNVIEDITFNRGNNKQQIITIKLNNADIDTNIKHFSHNVLLTFPNTTLPEQLQKELTMEEILPLIKSITPTSNNQDILIFISPQDDNYDFSSYQLNNSVVMQFWEASANTVKRAICSMSKIKKSRGISLNLPDTDITTILKKLAEEQQIELVTTASVSGKMTLKTQNMTWTQVLDVVLKTNKLDSINYGTFLIVASAKEVEEYYHYPSPDNPISRLIPAHLPSLKRNIFQVNYIDASTILKAFEQQKPKNNRGSISIDKRTNTIIAYQTQENLELLNKIIKEVDIPITQVQLESRIVEVNKDYIPLIKTGHNQGEPLDLLLNKMQKEGKGEIISQPKVTTSNKEMARIIKGEESCHYVTECPRPKNSIGFTVTPEVINDSQIKLLIKVSIKRLEDQNNFSLAQKQYEKIVNNNQTIILDGLEDLGYPIKNNNQSQLMITITSRIIDHKSSSMR